MFGDNGGQRGEFGDLMPGGLGVVGARFRGQRCMTSGADLGHMGDDLVDPVRGQAKPVMSAMAELSSGVSSRRTLDDRLGGVERVGRRGRGTIRGVALQLSEEFSDLGFEHGDPGRGNVQLATKPSTLRAIRTWGRSERTHGR
jgi:hypothetical protein